MREKIIEIPAKELYIKVIAGLEILAQLTFSFAP